jgi:multidrug efflux pump subunit AcrB
VSQSWCCPRICRRARLREKIVDVFKRLPGSARPRQAAAERPAGAVSGAVPRHGREVAKVRAIADQVKDIMRANPNTVGVNDNWNESVKVLRLDLDQDKMRALGVTSQTVMRAANTVLSAPPSASSARTSS